MALSRLQNYVDFPKKNGYRSVHTTVVHSTGLKMEFQVCDGRDSCLQWSARRRNPRVAKLEMHEMKHVTNSLLARMSMMLASG